MVFSSTVFLCLFLPLVLLLYFATPWIAVKNVILLAFSLFFYAWGEPVYVILMVFSVVINYSSSMLIHWRHRQQKSGKLLLFVAVLLNLGMLFYFKYFNFAADILSAVFHLSVTVPSVSLPIGISFYTFQGMSYVIDVYREKGDTSDNSILQKSVIKLALYISMFPQLIAGPIVRYSDIHKNLSVRQHTLDGFASGIEIFIIGLAKKVIFANILGGTADAIIDCGLHSISVMQAWFSALLYMLQIYYDFCGYSEMAIGLGKMFGFEFPQNFNYPYISRSITEFWRRWHISLSTWFRDYLYIPLGGNRRGNVYVNLSIVFLATGIWHGAGWSFVVWGMWHGMFMLIERVMKNKKISLPTPEPVKSALGWCYTMLVVFFGWIVFRLTTWSEAITFFKVMFGLVQPEFIPYKLGWFLNNRTTFVMVAALLCCVPWKLMLQNRIAGFDRMWEHPAVQTVKRILLLLLLAICFMLITNSTYNPFIYFRF